MKQQEGELLYTEFKRGLGTVFPDSVLNDHDQTENQDCTKTRLRKVTFLLVADIVTIGETEQDFRY